MFEKIIRSCIFQKKIKYIILPGIASAISINLILQAGNLVYGGFDQIFNIVMNCRVNAVIVGIAFPWQIVDALPVEPHDIFCTKVIY